MKRQHSSANVHIPMDFLSIPLYALGGAVAGVGWIYWRYTPLLRLHADLVAAQGDEVLLED